jgi:hypothetical protein
MADIAGALVKMLIEELDQGSVNSEAVQTKIGANINGLIDRPFGFEIKTTSGSWTCPANVKSILVFGVGGGGGGGGGANNSNDGGNGVNGNNTTFNSVLVASGGVGGERGLRRTLLYTDTSATAVVIRVYGGRGRGGGQSGEIKRGNGGEDSKGGSGAPSLLAFGGVSYGAGGLGGESGDGLGNAAGGGAGGGAGQIGFRLFTVTPSTTYNFVVGTGGGGGASAPDPFATAGAPGSAGALAIFYLS